jgi:hypothetical protein
MFFSAWLPSFGFIGALPGLTLRAYANQLSTSNVMVFLDYSISFTSILQSINALCILWRLSSVLRCKTLIKIDNHAIETAH